MPDTIRTLTELIDPTTGLFKDSNNCPAQSARDLIVSVYGGGLTPNLVSPVGSPITGAVGQLYICTIAGLTSNQDLTLPSASPGQKLGVYIADGDDLYSLIIKGAASQTINGGSAATEWSRVRIKGECVIFICTAANTWIVESDARIACMAALSRSGFTPAGADADYNMTLNTQSYDIGDIADPTTNNRFNIWRTGYYLASMTCSVSSAASNKMFQFKLTKNVGATVVMTTLGREQIYGHVTGITNNAIPVSLAAGDYLQAFTNHETTARSCSTTIILRELL